MIELRLPCMIVPHRWRGRQSLATTWTIVLSQIFGFSSRLMFEYRACINSGHVCFFHEASEPVFQNMHGSIT